MRPLVGAAALLVSVAQRQYTRLTVTKCYNKYSHGFGRLQRRRGPLSTLPSPSHIIVGGRMDQHTSNSVDAGGGGGGAWEDRKDAALAKCILPLTEQSHKGSSGRIAVIGGSERYTGAPYYAAMAALRTGVDLATVYCAEEAATPLKCYSPELMVQPVYCARTIAGVSSPLSPPSSQEQQEPQEYQEEQQRVAMMIDAMVLAVAEHIDSMHCLLIGPGLGRSPPVLTAVRRIIGLAMDKKKYLVLDADALVLLSSTTNTTTSMLDEMLMILLRNYDRVVLTPNAAEYRRLETAGVFAEDRRVLAPNAIVVQKGRHDVVATADGRETIQCTEIGGMKRPGGLGDVLAGTIAALVGWQAILLGDGGEGDGGEEQKTGDLALACWTACCIVKRATARAYERNGRAMSAQNVLDEIGPVFREMVE